MRYPRRGPVVPLSGLFSPTEVNTLMDRAFVVGVVVGLWIGGVIAALVWSLS